MKIYRSNKNNIYNKNDYAYKLSPTNFHKLEELYYHSTTIDRGVWVILVEGDYYEFKCKKNDDINVIKFCDMHME